jgi:hypothetical protein
MAQLGYKEHGSVFRKMAIDGLNNQGDHTQSWKNLPQPSVASHSNINQFAEHQSTGHFLWGRCSRAEREAERDMAVTKIKPIRGTVNKAIAYIIDPKKTGMMNCLFLPSDVCQWSAAKELWWTRNLQRSKVRDSYRHRRRLIQSFDVGEVTPEKAHEIGKQFADEWSKENMSMWLLRIVTKTLP